MKAREVLAILFTLALQNLFPYLANAVRAPVIGRANYRKSIQFPTIKSHQSCPMVFFILKISKIAKILEELYLLDSGPILHDNEIGLRLCKGLTWFGGPNNFQIKEQIQKLLKRAIKFGWNLRNILKQMHWNYLFM